VNHIQLMKKIRINPIQSDEILMKMVPQIPIEPWDLAPSKLHRSMEALRHPMKKLSKSLRSLSKSYKNPGLTSKTHYTNYTHNSL
jgi:hypothetical protein